MKLPLSAAALVALLAGGAEAFAPRALVRPATSCQAAMISYEEDLELTIKAIFKHAGGEATSSASAPAPAAAAPPAPAPAAVVPVDLSIPYDAAARLEFDATHKTFDAAKFEAFKAEYYARTVAMVTAKKAARDGAVAAPVAKAAPAAAAAPTPAGADLAIDYDAPARLAYTSKFGSFDAAAFADYKKAYVAGAVAMVMAKQQARSGDLSVPYDAAARLAFMTAHDGAFDAARYAKFKEEYEAKAVAEVSAKKK